jgi:hypothetical protein
MEPRKSARPGKAAVAITPPNTAGIPTRIKVIRLKVDVPFPTGPDSLYLLEILTAADFDRDAANFSIFEGEAVPSISPLDMLVNRERGFDRGRLTAWRGAATKALQHEVAEANANRAAIVANPKWGILLFAFFLGYLTKNCNVMYRLDL